MTRAPANLMDVRRLLLAHLDVDPKTSRPQDLEPAEVGIVGGASHRGGYHCGSDRVVPGDYSVVESTRDSAGLTLDASGLDIGTFSVTSAGRTHNLRSLSLWFVQQCVAGAADTRDIREIIYSPDGKTVRRWDRLGKRSTGDSSHLWHTHFSFFRDSTKAGRDQTPLFRRYLSEIGLISPPDMEDDMSEKAENEIHQVYMGLFYGGISMGRAVDPDGTGPAKASNSIVTKLDYLMARLDDVASGVTTLSGKDWTDEPAIVAGVLAGLSPQRLAEALATAGLTPEAIAAAVPPDIARKVVDELTLRLSG
ncbi:hypothetical protein E1258_08695 [Micromonospora sp. KC207]|uniref:hypothetical protein n=1 Tax=Micromonospora sp. KC207 TaxID=2530377 RepID=UPI00104370F2|nr:hypothetical protein [Micromonospora sp. KC207]TDC64229.1 hypothetical protein E1258_08695 [Micromonospora sp. KC207]